MFEKIGVQLYTVRDIMTTEEQTDDTLKKIYDLGIREVQLSGGSIGVENVKKLCDKHSLTAVSAGFDLDKILHSHEETMDLHKRLGLTDINISFLPPPLRESKEIVLNFINEVNAAAKVYAKNGFKISYHNHHFEFFRIDGTKTILDLLIENLDPETTTFLLDTCWLAVGGGDVRSYIEKLGSRCNIIHLKDMMFKNDGGKFVGMYTEVGNGSLNFKDIIKTAEDAGISHFLIEQDGDFIEGDPLKSLEVSVNNLKPYLK